MFFSKIESIENEKNFCFEKNTGIELLIQQSFHKWVHYMMIHNSKNKNFQFHNMVDYFDTD